MAAAAASPTTFLSSITKPLPPAIKTHISHFTSNTLSNFQLYPSLRFTRKTFLSSFSAVQDFAAVEEVTKENANINEEEENRRKLYVVNLPWAFTAPEIEKLFGECGVVKNVEIMKQKNVKSRGFAFVTMGTGEEAQVAVDKFNSYELMGRVIRVEFAKSFRKPAPPPPPGTPKPGGYKIYAANLAWKVRSANLKELFMEKFNPISARVVLDTPSGKSAGYGFIGFATMEEAEAAVSEMDGKELMGRPLRLQISQRADDKSEDEPKSNDTEEQSEQP